MRLKNGRMTFNTGKVLNDDGEIIGLGNDREVYTGYDSVLFVPAHKVEDWEDSDQMGQLTANEQRELADYMIARWHEFRDSAK